MISNFQNSYVIIGMQKSMIALSSKPTLLSDMHMNISEMDQDWLLLL